MKTTMLRSPAPLAAVAPIALAALAVACGGNDDQSTSSSSGNASDAAFIADMGAHHQGAIDMARIAEKRAQHAEIRQLAEDILSAQTGEISVMKTIRRDMHGMVEHGNGHIGMSEADSGLAMDPAELQKTEPFDRAFIDAMALHHRGAIAMAKQLLKNGEQPALRAMAKDIIDAQSRAITRMREWRKAWYGEADGPDDHMDESG